MSELAARIQARMDELGITPYRTALNAGLSGSAIRDIMRGKVRHPSAKNLAAIASALDCSIAYLLGHTEKVGPAEQTAKQPDAARPRQLPPKAGSIERVAEAIHEARAYMVGGMKPWKDASQVERETAIFLAGAAIEAYRRN